MELSFCKLGVANERQDTISFWPLVAVVGRCLNTSVLPGDGTELPLPGKAVNDNLLFLDREKGVPYHNLMTLAHLRAMQASGKLFARKFDNRAESRVLDEMDPWIGSQAVKTANVNRGWLPNDLSQPSIPFRLNG